MSTSELTTAPDSSLSGSGKADSGEDFPANDGRSGISWVCSGRVFSSAFVDFAASVQGLESSLGEVILTLARWESRS